MNQKSLPWRHLSLALTMTCIGIVLSLKGQPLLAWFFGQVLLAGAFLQWFCILHEAGHNTFFERRRANVLVGHLASFFSVLPFHSWQMIHHQHHLWTGWRDIDPTMSQTVPRELKAFEKRVMNFCWRYWVPLFSVLYRSNNYWNLPRLRTLFKSEALQETLNRNIWSLALVYVVCLIVLGPSFFIREFGFSFLLSLIFFDPILLSQHTHLKLGFSNGAEVIKIAPEGQAVFTRSLQFPVFFSRWLLLGFDAHELHHIHPKTPGYLLHRLDEPTANSHLAWQWIKAAKKVPADKFIFEHRELTGLQL